MIDDKESLLDWKKQVSSQPEGRVVLDLEADSLHRYKQKICLIQYATDTDKGLIDPLSVEDMSPFAGWLKDHEVWMHGADYDMSLFLMTWGTLPKMIYDTQTAARLLGFRQFGLAALVEHFFGVTLSKSSQKADWAKRPLSDKMVEYALNDVRYMLDMADTMVGKLQQLGRYDWFIETCVNALEKGLQRHETGNPEPWKIRGSGRLNRRGLAALKTLWYWRDEEAVNWDKPSFMVCSNDDLIRWSTELQEQKELATPSRFYSHRKDRFLTAVGKFYRLDEEEYPEKPHQVRKNKSPEFDAELERLIRHRDKVAEKLNMEPSFIAARYTLEAIAENKEKGTAHLLDWQRGVLGF